MLRVTNIRAVPLIACVAVAWLAVPPSARAQDACETARQALDKHDLLEAERQLIPLGVDGEACAGGLLKTVKQRRKAADRLATIGDELAKDDPVGARAAYAQAVALDRRSPAAAKLAALNQPAPPSACADAAKLFDEGYVARAKAKYLVQQEARQGCAKAGLDAVKQREEAVAALIVVAEGLRDGGDKPLATDVLRSAVRLDRGSKAARDALASIEAPDVFTGAREQGEEWLDRLEDLGVWLGAALAWVAALLLFLVAVAWLARVLQALGHALSSGWYRSPPGRGVTALAALVGLLVALWLWREQDLDPAAALTVVLAIVVVFAIVAPAGAVDWLQRTVFPVLLKVNDLTTGKEAKADPQGLSEQLANGIIGGAAHGSASVDSAGVPAGAADPVKDITTALSTVAPGKIAGALLSLVRAMLPSRTVYVGGHVHAAAGAGCGLSLAIVEGRGHMIGTITLWHHEYGPSLSEPSEAALRRIALAGAIWTRHRLHDEYGLSLPDDTSSGVSWESEAFYHAATEIGGGSIEAKQALYARALEHDAANSAAMFDSAVLDLRMGDLDKARRRLRLVAEQTYSDDASKRMLLWFKATYQQAVVALENAPTQPEVKRREALGKAYSTARCLLIPLLAETGSAEHGADAERHASLRRLEGPALVLMASIVLTAHKAPGEPTVSPDLPADWRLELDNTLDAVTTPFNGSEQLTASDLLMWVGAGDVVASNRTRYNLACYWSRCAALTSGAARANALKESLRQLELALALGDPDLKAWAERDPGLSWVQAARPDAIRRLTGKDPSGELATIRSIGPQLAARLETDHGIGTAKVLARISTGKRNAVALALGVSRTLVDRWVGLAGLLVLPQLTTEHLNRLDEAGVTSLAELGGLSADELLRRLVIASLRHDPVPQLPDHALLDVWVLEAAQQTLSADASNA